MLSVKRTAANSGGAVRREFTGIVTGACGGTGSLFGAGQGEIEAKGLRCSVCFSCLVCGSGFLLFI